MASFWHYVSNGKERTSSNGASSRGKIVEELVANLQEHAGGEISFISVFCFFFVVLDSLCPVGFMISINQNMIVIIRDGGRIREDVLRVVSDNVVSNFKGLVKECSARSSIINMDRDFDFSRAFFVGAFDGSIKAYRDVVGAL